MSQQKCMRCRTYFTGLQCPRCEYQRVPRQQRFQRAFAPYHPGTNKPQDGEVRIIQPAYRATDPCE